ncbi:hypothetical protein JCM8202_005533 [Rhodotorula sphaerocarpa]
MPAATVSELRATLSALSLDSRGNKDTLKRRLLNARKHATASQERERAATGADVGAGGLDSGTARTTSDHVDPPRPEPRARRPPGQQFDSFLVFDVEATCERIDEPWGRLAFAYPNEIIEWPVILLQWRQQSDDEWDLVKVDEYHSYVKPVWAREISPFCTELTGITQADLALAPTFPNLCRNFHRDFILRHHLFTPENRTTWVTDGPWDLRDFVSKTCYLSNTARPDWLAGEIIDLRLLAGGFFSRLKKEKKERRWAGSESPSPSPPPPARDPDLSGDQATDGAQDPAVDGPTALELPAVASVSLPPPLLASLSPSPAPDGPPPAPPPALSASYLPSHLLTAPATLSLPSVLLALTLPAFEGRLHSGLADARNASRILTDLARRGVLLETNRRVPEGGRGRERRWGWMEPGRRHGMGVELGKVKERWEEHVRKEQARAAMADAAVV